MSTTGKGHLGPAFSTATTTLSESNSSFIVRPIWTGFSTMYLRNEFTVKHKGGFVVKNF